jgi:KAP-like P-loop domain-containing protein
MSAGPVKKMLEDVVDDGPSAHDDFGPHSRIAGAIARLVTGPAGKGRCIALTGSWGSGKSSVIAQLEKKLKKDKAPVEVFVFDAWIHQGDPLRRCFLERLIESACELGTKWHEEWMRELDIVTGRREITKARQEKPASMLAVYLAISLLVCLPVAGAFMGRVQAGTAFWSDHYAQIAMVLYAIPLSLGMAALREGLGNLAGTVIRDLHQDTETQTVRTREASSIDFKKLFGKVAGRILADHRRRLVIVIDNLDRIDAENAVSMWTTMRTFFDFEKEPWNRRVWLIVPFDRSALRKLWSSGAAKEDSERMADSFLEKTFQIVFHLSPPVMMKLRAYFERLMGEVFDAATVQAHLESVYRIHGLLGPPAPSPRQIKTFLNRLRTQTLLWATQGEDLVPLPFLAVQILKSDKLMEDPTVLIHEEFLSPDVVNVLAQCAPGTDWRKLVAAAHLNVNPDDALQLLLFDRLKKALQAGVFVPLHELRSQPYFWAVFRRHADEEFWEWTHNPTVLANAIRFVEESSDVIPADFAQGIWADLQGRLRQAEPWNPLDSQRLKAIGIAMRRGAADAAVVERIVQRALDAVSVTSGMPTTAQWVGVLDETLQTVEGHLPKDFAITLDNPLQFVEAQTESIRRKPDNPLWRVLRLKPGVEVRHQFVTWMKELKEYDQVSLLRQRVVEGSGVSYAALNEVVLAEPELDLDTKLDFLLHAPDPPEAQLDAGSLPKILELANDQKAPRVLAAIMVLATGPAGKSPDFVPTESYSEDVINEIVKVLLKWKRNPIFCDPSWDSRQPGGVSLVRDCLQSLIRQNLASEIPVGPLARLYPKIKLTDPALADALARAVAARTDLAEAVA